MSIDDITLMALAGGELDAAEARLAADPQAQARLARFRLTRARLTALAEDASPHSGDADLTARIRAAGIAAHPTSGRPTARPATNRNRAPRAALAAGLAGLGIAIGWWLPGGNSGTGGMQEVLARVPAGEGAVLEDGTDVTVIASFRTRAGQLCREIETAGEGRARLAILCRDNASEDLEERFALDLTSAEGYQPALSELEGLDAFLADIDPGHPLSPADETKALTP